MGILSSTPRSEDTLHSSPSISTKIHPQELDSGPFRSLARPRTLDPDHHDLGGSLRVYFSPRTLKDQVDLYPKDKNRLRITSVEGYRDGIRDDGLHEYIWATAIRDDSWDDHDDSFRIKIEKRTLDGTSNSTPSGVMTVYLVTICRTPDQTVKRKDVSRCRSKWMLSERS